MGGSQVTTGIDVNEIQLAEDQLTDSELINDDYIVPPIDPNDLPHVQRVVTRLPWKSAERPGIHIASIIKREESTHRTLQKHDLVEQYDKIFKSYEAHGWIKRLPDGVVPYHAFNHFPVIKLSSVSTPVRPVFDAK